MKHSTKRRNDLDQWHMICCYFQAASRLLEIISLIGSPKRSTENSHRPSCTSYKNGKGSVVESFLVRMKIWLPSPGRIRPLCNLSWNFQHSSKNHRRRPSHFENVDDNWCSGLPEASVRLVHVANVCKKSPKIDRKFNFSQGELDFWLLEKCMTRLYTRSRGNRQERRDRSHIFDRPHWKFNKTTIPMRSCPLVI